MVRSCGGGGTGFGLRSAISRLARLVDVVRRCCGGTHHQHRAVISSGSTGLSSACRWWTRRCRLSRIAMPTGAAASLLLLLTIMSQSQAPQQNNGDYHPRRHPILGKTGQFPPEVITFRHYEDEHERKIERHKDLWGHKPHMRRIVTKNNTEREKILEKIKGKKF